VELSDERLEPFWARAAELGCIVFLHPFGCTLDERLDRWYLSNSVGQPTENAVALSHLIFSGVLDRHPGRKLIAAHGGGYLPTHIGRADHAWSVRSDAGADRVLLGSDFPFDMGTEDPVGALRSAHLPEADFHAVRGGNAAALLRLT
jgi:aminocarboxymuconate-semialdehyde decarboxylase